MIVGSPSSFHYTSGGVISFPGPPLFNHSYSLNQVVVFPPPLSTPCCGRGMGRGSLLGSSLRRLSSQSVSWPLTACRMLRPPEGGLGALATPSGPRLIHSHERRHHHCPHDLFPFFLRLLLLFFLRLLLLLAFPLLYSLLCFFLPCPPLSLFVNLLFLCLRVFLVRLHLLLFLLPLRLLLPPFFLPFRLFSSLPRTLPLSPSLARPLPRALF